MITDILGGNKTGAADAASSSKSAVAGRKGNDASGFSDALSGLDREKGQHHSDDVLQDEGKSASPEEQGATDARRTRPKPIIDIRPESLRQTAEQAEKSADVSKNDGAKTDERQMTPAEKKLRDALAAAKAIARQSDEAHEKRAASSAREAVGKQVPKDDEADLDHSLLAADDAKIADVLSLLGGGDATKAGEIGAMMQKHAVNAEDKRGKDADDGKQREIPGVASDEVKRFSLHGHTGADPLSMPSDPDAQVPGTRQFRFTNARGEGQSHSLDMVVGGGRGERASAEFKQSTSGQAENVAVLDSRRFLGLAPNSNGANLTSMLSGDPEWAAAMHPSAALSNAATQSSTGTVVNTLKLQMNPHDLGSVTAMLRLHGEELSVHLTVETRAAYRQLSEDSGGILDALRAQGFSVDQVSISIAHTANSDATGDQQGQAGQTGQQTMAEGGRQENAAGRGQGQAAERDTRIVNDAVSDNTAAAGPGGARPDHLYL